MDALEALEAAVTYAPNSLAAIREARAWRQVIAPSQVSMIVTSALLGRVAADAGVAVERDEARVRLDRQAYFAQVAAVKASIPVHVVIAVLELDHVFRDKLLGITCTMYEVQ